MNQATEHSSLPNPLAVYVTSSGHSGSTLLDILLGAHSKLFSSGELFALVESLTRNYTCACESSIRSCSFWTSIRERYLQDGFDLFRSPRKIGISYRGVWTKHRPRGPVRWYFAWLAFRRILGEMAHLYPLASQVNRWVGYNHERYAKNTLQLYERMLEVSQKSIVVDSTKEPFRMIGLHTVLGTRMRIIRLLRDGRGVFFSEVSKQSLPPDDAAHWWLVQNLAIDFWLGFLPDESVFTVRYEDLCREPRRTLEQICQWLGVEFEDGMLDRADATYHYVSGNPRVAKLPKSTNIVLDEKWRTELRPEELEVFERIAGSQNRRYGYADKE